MLLWTGVIEGVLQAHRERVLPAAAERSVDAAAMARAVFRSEGKTIKRHEFSA